MNFSRYPSSRAALFRTCGSSVLDPPGPFLPTSSSHGAALSEFLPGEKCSNIMKSYSYNDLLNEGLKAAAEKQKRRRTPLSLPLDGQGRLDDGGKRKAAKGKLVKGLRSKGSTARKKETLKLKTDADLVVDVAGEAQGGEGRDRQNGADNDDEEGNGNQGRGRQVPDATRGQGRKGPSQRQSSNPTRAGAGKRRGKRSAPIESSSTTTATAGPRKIVRSGHHSRPKQQQQQQQQFTGDRGSTSYNVPLDQIYDALSDA